MSSWPGQDVFMLLIILKITNSLVIIKHREELWNFFMYINGSLELKSFVNNFVPMFVKYEQKHSLISELLLSLSVI